MVKEKGTNTSDVICGKCLVPQAGAVWSRDLLHGGTPLIPSPLAESARRSSLSVLIPITAAVVTCLVGICIYCLVHTGEEQGLGPRSLGRRGWAKVGRMSAALLILGWPLWGWHQSVAAPSLVCCRSVGTCWSLAVPCPQAHRCCHRPAARGQGQSQAPPRHPVPVGWHRELQAPHYGSTGPALTPALSAGLTAWELRPDRCLLFLFPCRPEATRAEAGEAAPGAGRGPCGTAGAVPAAELQSRGWVWGGLCCGCPAGMDPQGRSSSAGRGPGEGGSVAGACGWLQRGCHRLPLTLLCAPAGRGRGAPGDGAAGAQGGRGGHLPRAGDPARRPASGPGGRQGEPHLGAGGAVRPGGADRSTAGAGAPCSAPSGPGGRGSPRPPAHAEGPRLDRPGRGTQRARPCRRPGGAGAGRRGRGAAGQPRGGGSAQLGAAGSGTGGGRGE